MTKLSIKLVRSGSCHKIDQKRTIRALGLHKLGQTVEHGDTPSVRGMISKVHHLVAVEEAKE